MKNENEDWSVVCCSHFPLIFIGGSQGSSAARWTWSLPEPTLSFNEESPHGRSKAVEPWPGRPTGLINWAWLGPNRPFPWPGAWLVGPLAFGMWFGSWLYRFSGFSGTFDPCDDMCHALIGRKFKPVIMPCLLANSLAWIHLHTISNNICGIR